MAPLGELPCCDCTYPKPTLAKVKPPKGFCGHCDGSYKLRKTGTISKHLTTKGYDVSLREITCPGSGKPPFDNTAAWQARW